MICGEYLLLRKAEVGDNILNKNVDKGFELSYFNLSYRRKIIRTLWVLPFLLLLICLIWFNGDNIIHNIVITIFIIVMVLIQLIYNYLKYKKMEAN